MQSILSVLDSKRFGINISKIDDIDVILGENFLSLLKSECIDLVITRLSAERIKDLNKLEHLGFEVKDIQSTYKFDYNRSTIDNKLKIDVEIRDAELRDVNKLMDISKSSFNNYGHYFADSKLNRNASIEIYSDWIRRSVEESDVADKVFVAEIGEDIAGFLSFKIIRNEKSFAKGGIGAVSSDYRNSNIFSKLVLNGLVWGKTMGLDWEEHNVLCTNYPVNGVFSKLGFRIAHSFITLHYWVI